MTGALACVCLGLIQLLLVIYAYRWYRWTRAVGSEIEAMRIMAELIEITAAHAKLQAELDDALMRKSMQAYANRYGKNQTKDAM